MLSQTEMKRRIAPLCCAPLYIFVNLCASLVLCAFVRLCVLLCAHVRLRSLNPKPYTRLERVMLSQTEMKRLMKIDDDKTKTKVLIFISIIRYSTSSLKLRSRLVCKCTMLMELFQLG